MDIVWWVLKIFGALFVLGLLLFLWVAVRMIFVGWFTERSLRLMRPYDLLADGVSVAEAEHDLSPLPYEFQPPNGDTETAMEVLLTPEGMIEEGRRYFDEDPNRTVWWLQAQPGGRDRVFVDGDVHEMVDGALGHKLTRFSEPALKSVSYVCGVDQRWFLLCGNRLDSAHVDNVLWQVDQATYQRHLLTKDPYFTFSRPPRLFRPDGFPGTVLVYYEGSVSYGFGGDCSRPRYSILRVFTESRPAGIDLARFSFKAGTLVDVEYRNGELIVTGDPSRPGEPERRAPRVWRVSAPVLAPADDETVITEQ